MKTKKELVDLFLGPNDLPKYIFGINAQALAIAKLISFNGGGLIDERTLENKVNEIPILHDLMEVPKNAIVLNCVPYRPVFVKNRLDSLGITNIDLYALNYYSGIRIEFAHWNGFKEFYNTHKEDFVWLYDSLSDEISKDTFRRLIDFRLNNNLDAMSVFKWDESLQYWEDFLDMKDEGESFVDVGGFDGNTTLQFIKRCPRYRKVYFFEPEPTIMDMAKKNLGGNPNIEYCQYAASNKKDILYFNSNGSASEVSNKGTIEVLADKIDSLVHSAVTLIKMDIEGSESLAIEGARETILKYHPRLAICVYHKSGDYIDIPKQVLSICNDYNIYLRHYSEAVIETVMFFMPKILK